MPGGPKLGCDRETATKFLTVATGGRSSSSNSPGASECRNLRKFHFSSSAFTRVITNKLPHSRCWLYANGVMIINLAWRVEGKRRFRAPLFRASLFRALWKWSIRHHPSPRSGKWAKLTFRVGNKSTIAICRADYTFVPSRERPTMLFVVGPVAVGHA